MAGMQKITRFLIMLIALLCATGIAAADDATPRPFQPVERPTGVPGESFCVDEGDGPAVRHRVVADVDYHARTIEAEQRIRYINRTGEPLDVIVFNMEPNRWAGTFTLHSIRAGRDTLVYSLDNVRLTAELPSPLLPDCEAEIVLNFRLDVPVIGAGVSARKGYFGGTARQLNLGHWLPVPAVIQNGVPITRQPSSIGEQHVLDKADWEVTINLLPGSNQVRIAAPGVPTQIGERAWRYVHRNSRDFSLSLSDQFTLRQYFTEGGVTVELYTLPDASETAAEHALEVGTRSLLMFADLFGPYLYDRLVIVQGDFPDGMEHSGLVFVGGNWFVNWPGNVTSYLTLITIHEVAHQWWYARVGNDAALTPWLDEALATYSEYIYLEEYHPELREWWWDFRVNQFAPTGDVDGTVYEFGSVREYINAVYLRGVRMMHDLRDDLGTDAFFDLLANYAVENTGEIAGPGDFWSLLTPEQLEATEATRQRYLRQPDRGVPEFP